MLDRLFPASDDRKSTLSDQEKKELYVLAACGQDSGIDKDCFTRLWKNWIHKILHPVSAFIVVDVQNDFISGSLALINCPAKQEASAVVPVINKLLSDVKFNTVAVTKDWHPPNHCSFFDNLSLRKLGSSCKPAAEVQLFDTVTFDDKYKCQQKMWPRHCVQGSWGAELHRGLTVPNDAVIINKGINPDLDSYSGFWDNEKVSQTPLAEKLQEKGVTHVFVCGIAWDVCVGHTAQDSLDFGFSTALVADALKSVDLDETKAMSDSLCRKGAVIIDSSQVKNMVLGLDRRPEMAIAAMRNMKLK
ncbi:PREDICTED: pyrazinamidase/nicotinamidase-like [Priapulus caudatus]|uniref:nicotinamidase n=1 Tax=Priapulus caudatus TaxID=37621 RepID=A0ABM1DQ03_PRICU|nr:PREDICTED: pyrazinamidase/nicotinamidase-like [Priapulus caudatus]